MRASHEARLKPLFIKALAGDGVAYNAWLHGVTPLLHGYCIKKALPPEARDDIVQEILISLHKARHTYEPSRPLMPWLAAIMHYRVMDWLRNHYRKRETTPLADVEAFLCSADVTDDALLREDMHKAVASLSAGQQAVIGAMYTQGLTVKETGEKLGMGESAVKVAAHRAYAKLRDKLGAV